MFKPNILRVLRNHGQIIFISLLYLVSRLLFLSTDFHVLEPDEALYARMGFDFSQGHWPLFKGKLFLEIFPLFQALAGGLQFLFRFSHPLIAVRTLAVIGGLTIGLALYWHGVRRQQQTLGVLAAVCFWLMPLVLFYSRSGTMDLFALGWVVLSLVLFLTIPNQKSQRLARLAGGLFAVAVLSKTAMLVFFLSFIFLAIVDKHKYQASFIAFLQSFIGILVSMLGIYYLVFYQEFFAQAQGMAAGHLLPLFSVTAHLTVLREYFERFVWYLSLPMTLVVLCGAIDWLNQGMKEYSSILQRSSHGLRSWAHNLKTFKFEHSDTLAKKILGLFKQETEGYRFVTDVMAFGLPAILFLALFDFSQRYFLLLTPVLAVLAARGLQFFAWKPLQWLWLIFTLPAFYWAMSSTLHTPFQAMKPVLQDLTTNHHFASVYVSFEEDKLGFYLDQEVKFLDKSALDGGIIIVDERKTELLGNLTEPTFQEMKQVVNQLPPEKLVWMYTDIYSHYPVDERGNVYKIYLIPQKP